MNFSLSKLECQHLRRSLRKEWIETNGLGDYASSTSIGCNTRRYHGLFVKNIPASATLPEAPFGRHVLLSTLEESVTRNGSEFFFSCRKHPGVYFPRGHEYLEEVHVHGPHSSLYRLGDFYIRREIMLVHEMSLLLVRYKALTDQETSSPVLLTVKPLLAYRHFHQLTQANEALRSEITPTGSGFSISPYPSLPPLYMEMQMGRTGSIDVALEKLAKAQGSLSKQNGMGTDQPPAMAPLTKKEARSMGRFAAAPDWFHAVEYYVENDRGFPCHEDLFKPGAFTVPIVPGNSVFISASTEPFEAIAAAHGASDATMQSIWGQEMDRRATEYDSLATSLGSPLLAHLVTESGRFIVRRQTAPEPKAKKARTAKSTPGQATMAQTGTDQTGTGQAGTAGADSARTNASYEVIAGYHWFDAWGRDTMIALPGLAFCSRVPALGQKGASILYNAAKDAKSGLVPNCYSADGNHAYNSVDASLWYVWAVQQMLRYLPGEKDNFVRYCWPFIKEIIASYSGGAIPLVQEDQEGFLHVGYRDTQLTWMDATAYGRPVTPRNGCPVEIMALWYNALAFAIKTALDLGERPPVFPCKLEAMSGLFRQRFFTSDMMGTYLADVWNPQFVDTSLRPNQLFALSLPYPILSKEDSGDILARVRTCLATPFGLRSLAPSAIFYHSTYQGGPDQRDSAYHQGTVWAWLIGAFGEAALAQAWDKEEEAKRLLHHFQPLFINHLQEAGMRSISEIFDGDPPHLPNGCIAQAWSVAECLRLLTLIKERAPGVFAAWEAIADEGGGPCGF